MGGASEGAAGAVGGMYMGGTPPGEEWRVCDKEGWVGE